MNRAKEKNGVPWSNAFLMNNIWVVIPVFNNWQTVKDVALGCRSYLKHVVVVDDKSNGVNVSQLFSGSDIVVLNNKKIPGK